VSLRKRGRSAGNGPSGAHWREFRAVSSSPRNLRLLFLRGRQNQLWRMRSSEFRKRSYHRERRKVPVTWIPTAIARGACVLGLALCSYGQAISAVSEGPNSFSIVASGPSCRAFVDIFEIGSNGNDAPAVAKANDIPRAVVQPRDLIEVGPINLVFSGSASASGVSSFAALATIGGAWETSITLSNLGAADSQFLAVILWDTDEGPAESTAQYSSWFRVSSTSSATFPGSTTSSTTSSFANGSYAALRTLSLQEIGPVAAKAFARRASMVRRRRGFLATAQKTSSFVTS